MKSDSFLAHLIDAKIKEVAEDSKYISIKFELTFSNDCVYSNYCYIEKSEVCVGNINAMVL